MEKDTDNALSAVAIVLGLLYMPLGGLVVFKLWNWFVPGIGGPGIGYLNAIGIDLLVSFIVYQSSKYAKETGEELLRRVISAYLRCCLCLVLGWVIKSLMIG